MFTASKFWIWKKVPGIAGRCNDIIYTRPVLSPSQDVLVYFGGDVQDLEENMKKHADSKEYIEWSLENTSCILATNFPKKHILVVRPSRMYVTRHAVFNCFDNFVPGNQYGVPSFDEKHNGLKHLCKLIKSCLEHLKSCDPNEKSFYLDMKNIKLTLMGFSKGCVVLNQFLHEFHYYNKKPESEVNNFIKSIQSMWWLDGGHGGSKDTWITEKSILKSFAELGIHVHVHVTPYQVEDFHRPWIRTEENYFTNTLHSMGLLTERALHFADTPRNLISHFKILKAVKDSIE